jgi:hypothetical protein
MSSSGRHFVTRCDQRSWDWFAMRCAHRHCLRKNTVVHSCMFVLARCVSAIRVARLMKSGHGSSKSSSVNINSCSRSFVLEVLLATLSVDCVRALASVGSVRRLGVPIISRSIRRCVRFSVMSIRFVSVQEAHAYIIVGVTVASKSRIRDCSG